jgi:hypothetical protein
MRRTPGAWRNNASTASFSAHRLNVPDTLTLSCLNLTLMLPASPRRSRACIAIGLIVDPELVIMSSLLG